MTFPLPINSNKDVVIFPLKNNFYWLYFKCGVGNVNTWVWSHDKPLEFLWFNSYGICTAATHYTHVAWGFLTDPMATPVYPYIHRQEFDNGNLKPYQSMHVNNVIIPVGSEIDVTVDGTKVLTTTMCLLREVEESQVQMMDTSVKCTTLLDVLRGELNV